MNINSNLAMYNNPYFIYRYWHRFQIVHLVHHYYVHIAVEIKIKLYRSEISRNDRGMVDLCMYTYLTDFM